MVVSIIRLWASLQFQQLLGCRLWAALQLTTRATGMVVFWKGACVCHMGFANASEYVPGSAAAGPICEQAITSGVGNYLPNLVLYPGKCTLRVEHAAFPCRSGQMKLWHPHTLLSHLRFALVHRHRTTR